MISSQKLISTSLAKALPSLYSLQAHARCYSNMERSSSSNNDPLISMIKPEDIPKLQILPKRERKPQTDPERQVLSNANEINSYLDAHINKYKNFNRFNELPINFGYNQHMHVDQNAEKKLREILWDFRAPIRYAFGYGSGVFDQGTGTKKPQVDLIFGVTYTQHWHSLNMNQNPSHYSILRHLGSGFVSSLQDKVGAGVFFNPFVKINDTVVKYGVVNIDTLFEDLSDWNTLYLAGRLHKPVKILRDDPRVRFVNQTNLLSALRVGLLLLPEKFTEEELYKTIAGISYMGDIRMSIGGENPNKVNNIVDNQFLNFRHMYGPLMALLPNLTVTSSPDSSLKNKFGNDVLKLEQNMDPIKRGNMVVRLPTSFKHKIYKSYSEKFSNELAKDEQAQEFLAKRTKTSNATPLPSTSFDQKIASDDQLKQQISQSIRDTITRPSISQTLKGVMTAGFGRSIKYASEKASKFRAGSSELNK